MINDDRLMETDKLIIIYKLLIENVNISSFFFQFATLLTLLIIAILTNISTLHL